MPAQQQPKLPKINVRIDCGKYFLRTAKPDDASERWAGWMADRRSVRLLNVPARVMSRQDVAAYIREFDQRSSLLIGIFEKETRAPIGFIRLDIAHAFSRALGFMFIGEGRYRHASVIDALGLRFQDYVFDTLRLRTLLTTVLARNRAMVLYLLKHGWTLDKTIERHVKSQTDGTMLDLCFLSLAGDAWRAWKKANLPPGFGSSVL
jgi:RimJ/RimL family protein N-acetyltransferase